MKKLQIGNVTLDNPVILAPMAGVSDLPFRLLCREMGAALVCMEMVSAKAIYYNNKNTDVSWRSIRGSAGFPAAVRLRFPDPCGDGKTDRGTSFFHTGSEYGLPVPKVVNNGEGSALMKDPKLVEQILTALVKAINKPVTVKIRKGFDDDHVNAVEIAKIAEACGVAAVAVHGRTRAQYYSGQAGLGYHRTGEGCSEDSSDRQRGCGQPGKSKSHSGTDRLRWCHDRSGGRRKSLDFPGGGILSGKRYDPGKTHEPGEAGNDPAPCGIAAGIQGRIHRCPGDAQAPVLVYGGNAPFRSFPPDHQYHGENGRTDPGSAGNLSGRSVVRILDTASIMRQTLHDMMLCAVWCI